LRGSGIRSLFPAGMFALSLVKHAVIITVDQTDPLPTFHLSVLEAQILVAIENVGWYAYLWFPIVYVFSLDIPFYETRRKERIGRGERI